MEQGRQTASIIPMVLRHCSHARVEHSEHFGWSMLEDMTGLPISVREMRCVHGQPNTSISPRLFENAVRFYEQNCRACPHRDPQGVPNLKTLAERTLDERRTARERADLTAAKEDAERSARAQARAQRVEREPEPTRALVSLIEGIDARTPDGRADELVDLCRVHPELATPPAAAVLMDFAANNPGEAIFAALVQLDAASVLDRDRLLEVTIEGLGHGPLSSAATLLVRLQAGLKPGQLEPILSVIAALAAPPHDYGLPPDFDLAPLHLAAAHSLPALLDRLTALILHEESYPRRIGAGAARRLIEHEPPTAAQLARPLLDGLQLPDPERGYLGSPQEELEEALGTAFGSDPRTIAAVIENRARRVDVEARPILFNVIEYAVRNATNDDTGHESVEAAIEVSFRRLGGDWGDQVTYDAAHLIRNTSGWFPKLMASRVDQLFGALMMAVSVRTDESPLGLPQAASLMEALHNAGRSSTQAAVIRELRDATSLLVPHAPNDIARNVLSVIALSDPLSDEMKDLRDHAVRLLGSLGQRDDLLPEVMPALWKALVHEDQRVRACGIQAWAKISRVNNRRLPADLGDLLPILLRDQHTIVHGSLFQALRDGLPIDESQTKQTADLLLGWAVTYANLDPDVLDQILWVLWELSERRPSRENQFIRAQCVLLAKHLSRHAKENFIRSRGHAATKLPGFSGLLLDIISTRPAVEVNGRDYKMLRLLRELPVETLTEHLEDIQEIARAEMSRDIIKAACFVEILQRATLWTDAAELAEAIFNAIPDTTEDAIERESALRTLEIARAEDALQAGSPDIAERAFERAAQAVERRERALRTMRYPWDET
ncbi:hypothetical protein [Conexibacter woesei]|nr:hypothetical protein [Conexibacter woesei]